LAIQNSQILEGLPNLAFQSSNFDFNYKQACDLIIFNTNLPNLVKKVKNMLNKVIHLRFYYFFPIFDRLIPLF